MKFKKLSLSLSCLVVLALLVITCLSVLPVSAASNPAIVLSQTSGETGTSITVSGLDFTPNYYYYIFLNQRFMLGQGTIDNSGAFSKSITINITPPANYEIMVFASQDKNSGPSYFDDYAQGAIAFFTVIPTPDPTIVLTPSTGKPRNSINVSGQYFKKGYYYYLFFDGTYLSKGTVDSSGKFTQAITIPDVFSMGSYDVTAGVNSVNDSSPSINKTYDEMATTYFTVVNKVPAVTLSNNKGKVGDNFTISGSDFSAGETITVYWDGAQIGSSFFPTTSNTFADKSYSVPETYYGSHTIKVADLTGSYSLSYGVMPDITLSSTSLILGEQITISGTGFEASSVVTFYIDNTILLAESATDFKGTFKGAPIATSTLSAGSHVVKAKDNAGNSAIQEINLSSPQPTSPAASTIPGTSTTAAPTSTTPTISTPSPTSSQTPTKTSTSTQAGTTSSAFPVWGIIVITIVIIAIAVSLVIMITRRRKSYR